MKDGWERAAFHPVADDKGRIVGKFQAPILPIREEIRIIKEFLCSISKQKGDEPMAEQQKQEKVNMVFLAGTLKFDPKKGDTNARALLDVGFKSCLQLSVYIGEKSEYRAVADKLMRYRAGDFIQVRCMLRPWSKKVDDQWKDQLSIDVTEIRNDPPTRAASPRDDQNKGVDRDDDRIPF